MMNTQGLTQVLTQAEKDFLDHLLSGDNDIVEAVRLAATVDAERAAAPRVRKRMIPYRPGVPTLTRDDIIEAIEDHSHDVEAARRSQRNALAGAAALLTGAAGALALSAAATPAAGVAALIPLLGHAREMIHAIFETHQSRG